MQQITQSGTTITLIHFVSSVLVPTSDGGPSIPQWRIACMPKMPESEFGQTMYHPPHHRSDDPRAVNCLACKKTQVFTDTLQRINNAAAKK